MNKDNLFQLEKIKLHSGDISNWKIECDVLTLEDHKTLAWIVAKEWNLEYSFVFPVHPTHISMNEYYEHYCVYLFRDALRKYELRKCKLMDTITFLIVDDVLTTGNSMEKRKTEIIETLNKSEDCGLFRVIIKGVVIFARGRCPEWIRPIFQFYKND